MAGMKKTRMTTQNRQKSMLYTIVHNYRILGYPFGLSDCKLLSVSLNALCIDLYNFCFSFKGTGAGIVNRGPFANWLTPDGPLTRNTAGGSGSLVRQSRIDFVMQFCTHDVRFGHYLCTIC